MKSETSTAKLALVFQHFWAWPVWGWGDVPTLQVLHCILTLHTYTLTYREAEKQRNPTVQVADLNLALLCRTVPYRAVTLVRDREKGSFLSSLMYVCMGMDMDMGHGPK
jgi:hypothetical protein